jgi:hypothetical protein
LSLLPREAESWMVFHWCPEYEALAIGLKTPTIP